MDWAAPQYRAARLSTHTRGLWRPVHQRGVWVSRALTRPRRGSARRKCRSCRLGPVVDHLAALWLRLELAEGVATVQRCSHGRAHTQTGGRAVHQDAFALAGHCGALAEHCLAQVPVVSGGGWWSSEAAPM